tara:strand:+ start:871 stop:3405 length:2535 start_codon:yes stop_codon:yes gene_type:complete
MAINSYDLRDRYLGMEGYGMEPTDIDPVLMQDNLQRSQTISTAREMLSRGAPIENVAQATGLDRQTIENIFMKDTVMGAPDNPTPNPVAPAINLTQELANAGIMGNSSDNPDTQRIIQGMNDGEGEGADIKEFLDLSLGANKGDDDDLTPDQAVTSGGLAGAMNDETSFMSYLEGSSMLEGLADPEKMEIYKQAAANMVGELDYDTLIDQPDKVMPYLAAGLSLINSGEKGEDWGAALGKAFISGYGSKRKEERDYTKTKAGLQLRRQSDINNIVSNMALTDVKDRVAFNNALKKQKVEDDSEFKMYDIKGSNGFANKDTRALSTTQYNAFVKLFPDSIRPKEKMTSRAFTVETNGKVMNVFLDEDQLKFYQSNGFGGDITEGHNKKSNMKLYQIKDKDSGDVLREKFLTPTEVNDLPENEIATGMPTGGNAVFVYDKLENKTDMVSPTDILRNSARYNPLSTFTANMTLADGTTLEIGNNSTGSRNIEKQGIKQFNVIRDKIQGIDRSVDNYFVSADNLDDIVNEFTTKYPEQADLAFDNMAGNFASTAESLIVSLKGIGAAFNLSEKEGGAAFYDKDKNKVSFDQYKLGIISSDEFATFRNSPIAKFLEANDITGARLDAALFDLSMLGAASYSPEKGLDLRAISDFETKKFMAMQGAQAKTLKQFKAITKDFRSKLLGRNIKELERSTEDLMLMDIVDADGKPMEDKIKAIRTSRDKYMAKLLEKQEKLSSSIEEPIMEGIKTFVGDKSIDPDNPDVIEFNTITANPESKFGQKYGLTVPLTTETETELEGTYRQMLNKYSDLKANVEQQDEYVEQLQKTLRPEEFAFFQAHILRARTLGL